MVEQRTNVLMSDTCDRKEFYYYLCEFDSASGSNQPDELQQRQKGQNQTSIHLADISVSNDTYPFAATRCPDDHWVPTFLACDSHSSCWADDDVTFQPSRDATTAETSSWCAAPGALQFVYFLCSSNGERLPFTLVCDYHADCFDGSDEDFCVHPPCPPDRAMPCGDSGQCVHGSNWCNLKDSHCKNSFDARLCNRVVCLWHLKPTKIGVDMSKVTSWIHNFYSIREFTGVEFDGPVEPPGPPTHFQCSSLTYYFPVFVRCNGVYDCPYKEDEVNCEAYSCPGYFRCRQSRVCLHPDHVCNGRHQCPQHDDEWYCSMSCPGQCVCQGLAFTCAHVFHVEEFPDVRYLDVSGSGMKAQDFFMSAMLIYLAMKTCMLTELLLPELPNLKILDVSHNHLKTVSLKNLNNVTNLNCLVLANNPLTSFLPSESAETLTFPNIRILDLASVNISNLDLHKLQSFPGLAILNLSGSGIEQASGARFVNPVLVKLDLRGSEMTEFPHLMLKGLSTLEELYADNFKLCCVQTLPDHFNPKNCHGPSPIFSTCDHLLGIDIQRVLIYLLTALTLLGNGLIIVLGYREKSKRNAINILVSHFCSSKFLTGMYFFMLCVGDQVYSGSYMWGDIAWRSGIFCKMSGFIFLLSCEAAVCLNVSMTLERCVALSCMNREGCPWKKTVTLPVCLLAWLAGVGLSIVPPVTPDSEFSQTSLCVPLPLPGDQPGGHHYAFSVLVVLNTALMLMTVAGQTYIYIMVKKNTLAFMVSDDKAHEFTAASRVVTIALMDACCWCLVTLWAALTSQGAWNPGDVISSLSVFFIIVSTALTPYLYLLNGVLERRRQVQKQRVLQRLTFQLRSKPG